ncbi:MAG: hypothetical protein AB4352_26570 [Hormoscilla sp.]
MLRKFEEPSPVRSRSEYFPHIPSTIGPECIDDYQNLAIGNGCV